jgi:hypothetical protein
MSAVVAVGRTPVGSAGLDSAELTKSSTVGAMPVASAAELGPRRWRRRDVGSSIAGLSSGQ